jgi:polyphosphate kinase
MAVTGKYISSGDSMTRNTERRVEIACPIFDKHLSDRMYNMLVVLLSDNIQEYFVNQAKAIGSEYVAQSRKYKIMHLKNVVKICARLSVFFKKSKSYYSS